MDYKTNNDARADLSLQFIYCLCVGIWSSVSPKLYVTSRVNNIYSNNTVSHLRYTDIFIIDNSFTSVVNTRVEDSSKLRIVVYGIHLTLLI